MTALSWVSKWWKTRYQINLIMIHCWFKIDFRRLAKVMSLRKSWLDHHVLNTFSGVHGRPWLVPNILTYWSIFFNCYWASLLLGSPLEHTTAYVKLGPLSMSCWQVITSMGRLTCGLAIDKYHHGLISFFFPWLHTLGWWP